MYSFGIVVLLIGNALAADPQLQSCVAKGTCPPLAEDDEGLDSQILLQTAASKSAGDDLCPSDVAEEATTFWKDFFRERCNVDWDEDVPKEIKEDIGASHSFHLEQADGTASQGCRIVTSLADVGGAISFDTLPPSGGAPTGEGWSGQDGSAVRQMKVDGQIAENKDDKVCDIFGDGVRRLATIPPDKVSDVFQQVKEDFKRECPHSSLTLATDLSAAPVMAKRSMADADGKSMYNFVLSVSASGSADDVNIEVWAEETPLADSDATISARDKAMENQIKRDAEKSDNEEDIKKGGAGLISYGDVDDDEIGYAEANDGADVASYIQGRLRVQKSLDVVDAPRLPSKKQKPTGATSSRATYELGPLLVLDDRTAPLLCCLCGSCPEDVKGACSEGAEAFKKASFIEDDEEEKMREQELLYPQLAPNLLLQVRTAKAGSKEELLPPPIPGDVPRRSDSRVRADPEFGDNFHALILPRRTAADHKRVWSQSRALIETVKTENITIGSSYHFYDHADTARCFQGAYNQGKCGSCWAFASLGALEKQICLRAKGDVKASLSREMLVRCSEQNNGCGGGNADKAYEDLMEIGGVFSTDCLPYQGEGSKHCPVFAYSWFGQGSAGKTGKFARIDQEIQKSCSDHTRYSNRPPQGREWDMPFQMMYEERFGQLPDANDQRLARFRRNFAKTRSRDRVPSWWLYGQESMKAALHKYGSIYASFKVRNDFKNRECPDGCWPPGTSYGEEAQFKPATCGCGKGHAVHIVGFGEDIQETGTKIPYWLIENSWGDAIHGDVFGEDAGGVKAFGKDPFTEEHPLGMEDKCLLAGWAYSALPRTGGCGGNAKIDLRDDQVKGGPPDGYHLSVKVDGVGMGNWSIKEDSVSKFAITLDIPAGAHNITFQAYAKNHPKQQAFDVETYGIMATSLRCRGKGYRYSFTQNDTKAKLSWGRLTRKELKAAADALIPTSTDESYLYGGCPADCRTGRYSWVKPCLGLLSDWGSCYTDSWAITSSYMLQHKKAMCTECEQNAFKVKQQAYAVKSLDNATFLKWYELVQQSWDAPDDPGWMRMNTGNCKIKGGGFVRNALLSAEYAIDMPGNSWCDERHSAPYAQGKFVHAPGKMEDGAKTTQRCPPPMMGVVNLVCRQGALYAESNTCALRPGAPESLKSSRGYYKTVRGVNYHGIEAGAAFGIAEMNRFAARCPTLSWSRWSECNVSLPCAKGVQHRSRTPISLSKSDPKCSELLFHEERPCVGPGFCPQVLTRFVATGSANIGAFMGAYKTQSTTMTDGSYATAGAAMMETASPDCAKARYLCKMTTGAENCAMYMEGHFEVKKDAEYYFHYLADSGDGILEFNALGEGSETKPQYQIRAGTTSSSMHEWQDLGFHHRRRRSESQPWQRISTMKLTKGTYYARMTRSGWTCPEYKLRLEQLTAVYRNPILLGAKANKTAASMVRGSHGGATQKTTTWWNNWGAIASWTKNARARNYGGSYAKKSEAGAMNELVLRDQNGGKVVKKVPITKFNFSADELYTLVGVDRFNLPDTFSRWGQYELVLRNTVILPEEGEYVFKFSIDTAFDEKQQAWQQSSRRRHTKFEIRAGTNPTTGVGGSLATCSEYQGSATKSVSFKANQAGTVPFEASILTTRNAPGDKMLLPNSVFMEVKRKDVLHGESLVIGSKTKYMSDLSAIRGDTDVRIDWPERDDPLSSELKSQTFDALPPQALLIGNQDLLGFQALAEAKIDAGACTSLEAWDSGADKASTDTSVFWGVALNLCDVDGNNQFLELVTYHPPSAEHKTNGANNTKVRVGWVHIGFTQPTHLRIVRDPTNLGNFDMSYRPDNRDVFATPFATVQTGFHGKMEVGVSMNSPEAYRYAEFYNISIEECPTSCEDISGPGGKQLYCGDIVTPCGNKVNCPKGCSGGNVCKDEMCMDCPALTLTANQQNWECGTISQTCTNIKGQKIQLSRDVGTKEQPSVLHFCKDVSTGTGNQTQPNYKWHCVGQSKWTFLAEGKECGQVTDNCLNKVDLFSCPQKNDMCVAHKCQCYPTSFEQDYNCGSEADGCGKLVHFGAHQGACPGATDRCMSHKCCTPKTRADFSTSFQCGRESDGCGGFVELSQANATSFIKVKQDRTNYNYWDGQRGIEIEAAQDITVKSLGRGLMTGATKLSKSMSVSIWDVASKTELGRVEVGPHSTVKDGYAWEPLSSFAQLKKGSKFRIVQKIERNMVDKYTSAYMYGNSLSDAFHARFASLKGLVQTSTASPNYPEDSSVNRGQGVGIVNFEVLENEGCGAGLWTCHANHSCTKKEVKGFLVESGLCKTDGNCVMSPNYPSNYNNNDRCTITSPSAGSLTYEDFNTESYFDHLTVDDKKISGRSKPQAKELTAPVTLKWESDGSVPNKGFKVCVGASLLQEEVGGLDLGQASLGLAETELANLSESERQHALEKYKQKREDDAAGAIEAERLTKEADENQALMEQEESVLSTLVDSDELVLPDLTEE